jgi:hypothetical protein
MRAIILFSCVFLTCLSLGAALPDSPSLDQPLPAGIQITWANASDALTYLTRFPVVAEASLAQNERDELIGGGAGEGMTIRRFLEAVERQRPEYRVETFHPDSSMPIVLIYPRDPEASALGRTVEIQAPTTICALIEQASRDGDFIHSDALFRALGVPVVHATQRPGAPGEDLEAVTPENAAFCEKVRQFEGLSRCTFREALVAAMAEDADPMLIYRVRRYWRGQGIAFYHARESALHFTFSSEPPPPALEEIYARERARTARAREALRGVRSTEEYFRVIEQLRRERAAAASPEPSPR